jgi:hypothetical protein
LRMGMTGGGVTGRLIVYGLHEIENSEVFVPLAYGPARSVFYRLPRNMAGCADGRFLVKDQPDAFLG